MNTSNRFLLVGLVGIVAALCGSGCKFKSVPKKTSPPTEASSSSADPTLTAKLLGSCDTSATSFKSCTETFEGSGNITTTAADCTKRGGVFRNAPCPRIGASYQCLSGKPPYLSASYSYDPKKAKPGSDLCQQGVRDYAKTPELAASKASASCNAIAKGGVCIQLSALTDQGERTCLDNSGTIKQPPEPCPSENGLVAYKHELPDHTEVTRYFYTTPYTTPKGQDSWTRELATAPCSLKSIDCTFLPFPSPSKSASSAKASAKAKPR